MSTLNSRLYIIFVQFFTVFLFLYFESRQNLRPNAAPPARRCALRAGGGFSGIIQKYSCNLFCQSWTGFLPYSADRVCSSYTIAFLPHKLLHPGTIIVRAFYFVYCRPSATVQGHTMNKRYKPHKYFSRRLQRTTSVNTLLNRNFKAAFVYLDYNICLNCFQ